MMRKEVRLHGRGGQGVVMASEMLVRAFVTESKYACSFPMFGGERRGAPVSAFVRFDDVAIRAKTQVYNPDCLIISDPSQIKMASVFAGLKEKGIVVLNNQNLPEAILHENANLAGIVDATSIAIEEIGVPITNTCMLGAFAATTSWISLESVLSAIGNYFQGDRLNNNIRCVERGFHEVKIIEW